MPKQESPTTTFTTTITMSHSLRAEIDIVRALVARRTGRRPPAREIITAAIEAFVARERSVAQRAR